MFKLYTGLSLFLVLFSGCGKETCCHSAVPVATVTPSPMPTVLSPYEYDYNQVAVIPTPVPTVIPQVTQVKIVIVLQQHTINVQQRPTPIPTFTPGNWCDFSYQSGCVRRGN